MRTQDSGGGTPTYAQKTKEESNVRTFKIKFNERTTYLHQEHLGKIAQWASKAGKIKGLFQRTDVVEIQFAPGVPASSIETLEELQVSEQARITTPWSKWTLLRLQQVPMEVDDQQLADYIGHFAEVKGLTRRLTYRKFIPVGSTLNVCEAFN